MADHLSRRKFLKGASAGAAGLSLAAKPASFLVGQTTPVNQRLALLGGKPVRTEPFPAWPVIENNDRKAWMEILESRRWSRLGGRYVAEFEKSWAEKLGARYVLATASGTSALATALNALEVGPGDEVIVPPYTFVATVNVVLLQHALPVFVDTDRETSQIDARKIEAAITGRTRAVLPVHLGGSVADMDTILKVTRPRSIPVVEDACQSHLAEWRHKKVASIGDMGCFSFQASKNLNCSEGGALVTNNPELMRISRSFHNAGRYYSVDADQNVVSSRGPGFSYERNGDNRRLTEFQGVLLLTQLARLEEQARRREQNAAYLKQLLKEIPGVTPQRIYDGCTRHAYHIFMCRYDREAFGGLSRRRFLQAMRAEGIRCSGGYRPLNKEPFLKATLESRAFRSIYSARQLAELEERNHCPENDKLCQEALSFSQTSLLGTRSDLDQIVEAIRKIHRQAEELARAPLPHDNPLA